MTVHFCWLCDEQADPAVPVAPHYEQSRPVRFCSFACRAEYLCLAAL